MNTYKISLSEAEMPQEWYNIQPDMPLPLPPYLHPATGQPVGPQGRGHPPRHQLLSGQRLCPNRGHYPRAGDGPCHKGRGG